jgi:Protein of unknown function (DUF2442)
MMHFVEKLLEARPYRLRLQFHTGETLWADMEHLLRSKAASPNSAYAQLLDPAVFLKVRFDPDSRTICWDGLAQEIGADGAKRPAPLDLCPDVLYELAAEQTKAQSASLSLKEEPPPNGSKR